MLRPTNSNATPAISCLRVSVGPGQAAAYKEASVLGGPASGGLGRAWFLMYLAAATVSVR